MSSFDFCECSSKARDTTIDKTVDKNSLTVAALADQVGLGRGCPTTIAERQRLSQPRHQSGIGYVAVERPSLVTVTTVTKL